MSDSNRLGISIQATNLAGQTIEQLKAQIKGLQEAAAIASGGWADQTGKVTAAINTEISAIRNEISARNAQVAAIKEVTAAVKEQAEAAAVVHRTFQESLNIQFNTGADRQIKSAAESARTLATSLSAAAEADARLRDQALAAAAALERQGAAVRTLSGEQFFATVNRRMGIGQKSLSAEESAAAFSQQLGPAGTGINIVETKATIDALQGLNREMLSAKDSAAVFQRELGALGSAVQTAGATSFNRMVADLVGVKQSFLSASESASVFERELGPVGTGIKSLETKATIDSLQGVGREMLSAAESAKVFERSMGELGTAVRTIASFGFSQIVSDLNGVQRSFLSAEESAAVFVRELGELGTAVRTTASSGFSQMVADLAGVKMSYLSAAESAKVFQAALGETMLEETSEATVRRGAIAGGRGKSAGGGNLNNELRHVVASFDELSRGQRGQLFGTIGAALRDAGVSAASLATGIGGLAVVMSGAAILRGAESMGKWAVQTRAAASAAGMSIGAYSSLQGALQLVGLKGEEADSTLRRIAINLSTALADPASKAAEAFHNLGISQADLVKNGQDVDGALKLLADAFVRTNDGANKSAAMSEIAGKGFESIIPALQNGKTGLEELEAKAKSLGLTLSTDTDAKLEKTGETVKELGEKIRGDSIKAFEAWAPAIDLVATALGGLLSAALKVIAIIPQLPGAIAAVGTANDLAAKSMIDQLPTGLGPVSGGGLGGRVPTSAADRGTATPLIPPMYGMMTQTKTDVPPMTAPVSALQTMKDQMTAAALAASKGGDRQAEMKAEIDVMKQTLATAQLTDKERTELTTQMQQKEIELNNSVATAGSKAAKQSYQDFAAAERLKITEAQGASDKIQAIYSEWMKAAESQYKQSASTILAIEREKIQALNTMHLQQIKDGAKLEEEQNRATQVMGQAQSIASGTMHYPGQPTIGGVAAPSGQGTAQLQAEAAAIEASAQKEVAALQEVMRTADQGSDTQKAAAQEIMSVVTQAKSQEVALYNKAAEAAIAAANKANEAFNKFFDSMGSSLQTFGDSIIKALIAPQQDLIKQGLTTKKFSEQGNEIRSAISKMLLSGINDAAKGIESALSEMLAKGLSSMLSIPMQQGGGLGSLLGSGLSKLLGIGGSAASALPNAAQFGLAGTQLTAAGTSLNAAAATLNSSAVALSTAATTLSSSSATSGAAGAAGGGGGILSTIGGLFGFAGGGIVPSAAGGMVSGGTGASLALLHAKEMVLPERLSTGIQQMISTGGARSSSTSLNAPLTINNASRGRGGTGMTRSEFSQMLSMHSGALLGEARGMMRGGWRPA